MCQNIVVPPPLGEIVHFYENSFNVAFQMNIWEKDKCFQVENTSY